MTCSDIFLPLIASVVSVVIVYVLVVFAMMEKKHARLRAETDAAWKPQYGYCRRCGEKRALVVVKDGFYVSTGQPKTYERLECVEDCGTPPWY